MSGAILKSISVENFCSFAERMEFTTESVSKGGECPDNAFISHDVTYNKVSYVYGANGSGKTFFCKVIREIQRLLVFSPLSIVNDSRLFSLPQYKGINEPVNPFAFDVDLLKKPTLFSIEIVIDGVSFKYSFSVLGRKICSEELTRKTKRTEQILIRTSPSYEDIVLKSDLKDFEKAKHMVKEDALCLPVASMMNNTLADVIVKSINEITVINMAAAKLRPANSEDAFTKRRAEMYQEVLKAADPTLRRIDINLHEEEIPQKMSENDDFENREYIIKKRTVDVKSKHAMFVEGREFGETSISFFHDESLGTIKLFTALPYLYDALESGGILVIDEIENGLHLSLVEEIINLFNNPITNPNNSMLICTSHQPLLLRKNVRKDQVWVTRKDEQGRSTIHRMNEYKTSRAKVNLANRILEGALGCNPELFFKEGI